MHASDARRATVAEGRQLQCHTLKQHTSQDTLLPSPNNTMVQPKEKNATLGFFGAEGNWDVFDRQTHLYRCGTFHVLTAGFE